MDQAGFCLSLQSSQTERRRAGAFTAGSMAEAQKRVPALGWWLMLVGSLRLASVWFGFFDIWALRLAVFSQTQSTCHIPVLPTASFSPTCLVDLVEMGCGSDRAINSVHP
jgi:hypothetical protein